VERVIYALLEKAAKEIREGRKPQFPLWLAPSQVRVIPVKPEYLQYCKELAEKITGFEIRVDVDDRNESVGKSIRDAETEWIPYVLVIGEKEVNAEKFSIRDRKSGNVKELKIDELVNEIKEQTKGKPFMKLNMNRELSKRPQIMV
jgi:threonyl-tRNA synthetase